MVAMPRKAKARHKATSNTRRSISFSGFRASSSAASKIAKAGSRKSGTRCELMLRLALKRMGASFSTNVRALPGKPDIAFFKQRVAVFVDGDFWHGRHLEQRLERLQRGANAKYWTQKIVMNVLRDSRNRRRLRKLGWRVVRVWEADAIGKPERAAARVLSLIGAE
jgi:DNA mismatch endonuclease, patch repair protein